MITQLLNISTTPIKYELEIKQARLEYSQDFKPDYKSTIKPAKIDLKSKNTEVKMNTYQARHSYGQGNLNDFGRLYADMGMDSIKKTTGEYVEIGNEMTRIDIPVTIADIYAQKMLSNPVLYQAFIPREAAYMAWEPHQMEMNYQAGKLTNDWEIMRNIMNYVPGSVRMNILEQPKVHIEYVGRPMYIPPSADPDFVEVE